ncbi:hypothetical protein NC652_005975 [Populus alba x Populus x berolinensis]|nr:hypothetical protein NC652_005975 [Populus alba x Populus x berolinensis]
MEVRDSGPPFEAYQFKYPRKLYYSLLIKSPRVKSIISKASGSEADLLVEPGGHDDACLVEFVLS